MSTLVIDDEPFMLKLLSHQLANLGISEVRTCERASDAIALLEGDGADVTLLLCDLQMPDIDGVEVVRRLARIGYTGDLVLVSGENQRVLHATEKLANAHNLNVLGILHKPFSPDVLQAMLQSRTSRSPRAPHTGAKTYAPEELRLAIAGGKLLNVYQPKVELATGAVAGVETLVRWRHPRDGMVFPDQFIAVAEEHNLIDDLTRTVLAAALRQARLWQEGGLDLNVAVNVSMDNLVSLTFPNLVARAVNDAGIPAKSLTLEVTESRLMKNPIAALDILTRLRLKGAGLAIDDFGTGHSSLAQLRDMPFDELKIDRGFVNGAHRNSSLRAIFEGSLVMAKQLGMKTVAEGVEDRDDWNFLRAAGCDLAQGYFIAKPMPASELVAWIGTWQARRAELGL